MPLVLFLMLLSLVTIIFCRQARKPGRLHGVALLARLDDIPWGAAAAAGGSFLMLGGWLAAAAAAAAARARARAALALL
eukprot:7387206-Prymnesium_polylepis.1